jgi:hypothetical protein
MARLRHEAMFAVRSLSGAKRTSRQQPIFVTIDPSRTLAHWSVLVLLFTIKSGKAPTVLTLTATLNRSVLACSGYLLRCTRRCHTPFIFYISYSSISINAGSFGGELVN